VLQILMEADVEGLIGAGRHERSPDRLNYRNGDRGRTLDTRLGPRQLRLPKLRQGSYFPPFLEPRTTSARALVAVIEEAWIGGVSTRRVDDRVQAMGLAGISRSRVSKLCKEIDERVDAFLARPLEGEWPSLWLAATYLTQREGGRIVAGAAIIAVAASPAGRREIGGLHIGPSPCGAVGSPHPTWSRNLLVDLPQAPGQARAHRGPAESRSGGRRGTTKGRVPLSPHEGAEAGDRPGAWRQLAALPRAWDAHRPRAPAQEPPE
jgi:hypothetical protein